MPRRSKVEKLKHPLAGYAPSTVIPREHSDRGNLLTDYALSTRVVAGRLRGDSSLKFRMTTHGAILYAVMLSEVEASPRWLYTINAGCRWSASRRFFTNVQNDNTWCDTIRCHAERSRSIPSLAIHYQRGLSLVGFEEILH